MSEWWAAIGKPFADVRLLAMRWFYDDSMEEEDGS